MTIESGLTRQKQGMAVLFSLLEEEFSALMANTPGEVASLEFSIQELVRQLMDEKEEIRSELDRNAFSKLADYIEGLKDDDALKINEILKGIRALEDKCAVQAMKNNEIARALAEQSAGMVNFFYDQLAPRDENVYSSKGRWNDSGAKSTGLLRGRL
ncbi:flagellar export chaperone FlgN [Desulfonatronovibrio hydrogenovorans]|uniref:flagellar export chaperone FlgN n=1 Tax=Desulfonatronovibrio hydrogenovorans TaxID=53245 RepID=UPI00048FA2DB|nr:flagellar export chaperone FlgN [Desulfonatronovibrio hydrogenovorans]